MAKKQKHTIEIDFLDLKTRFKAGKMSIEEVDHATCKLIAELAVLTVNGVTEINGVSIVYTKIECGGLWKKQDCYLNIETQKTILKICLMKMKMTTTKQMMTSILK